MELRSLIPAELVFPGLEAPDRRAVLGTVARRIADAGAVADGDRLLTKLLEREELGSTALGSGVAIPHCKLPGQADVFVAVATVPGGVDFGAPDGKPVRLLFVVVSPEASPAAHLRCLSAISTWIKVSGSLEDAVGETDPEELRRLLVGEEPESGRAAESP